MASSSSHSRSNPTTAFKYRMPLECKTWYSFKEKYDQKSEEERVIAAGQARELVSRAIKSLEKDVLKNKGNDPRSTKQRETDVRGIRALTQEKNALDAEFRTSTPRHTSKPIKQQNFPGVAKLDDDTMRLISGLDQDADNIYVERRANERRRRRNGNGLVDGVQILDDYTEAMIREFNQKLALEERKAAAGSGGKRSTR